MYKKFFNLHASPFSITPDPRFLYLGQHHREALAHLLYSVQGSSGFILLTGEVGAGKTSISRCLVRQTPDHVDVALIFNPKLSALELVASICDELGIPHAESASIKTLIDALNQHLMNRYAKNHTTVLILDEAQNLSVDLLEQVRLLSNLETDSTKLLQIILIGQPELITILAKPEMRQFSQRITARYHIAPLRAAETRNMVRHRLAVAGCEQPIFSFGALWVIHRATKGIPRLINQVCDRALLAAYTLEVHHINVWIAHTAAREVMGVPLRRKRRLVMATLVLLGLAVTLTLFQNISISWNRDVRSSHAGEDFLQSFLETASHQLATFTNARRQESSVATEPQSDKQDVAPAPPPEPPKAKTHPLSTPEPSSMAPDASPQPTVKADQQHMIAPQPITEAVPTNVTKALATPDKRLTISTDRPTNTDKPTGMATPQTVIVDKPIMTKATPPPVILDKPIMTEHSTVATRTQSIFLDTIFSSPSEETTNQDAIMAHLFSLWGVPQKKRYRKPSCEQALRMGLGCSNLAGNWNTIRRLGLPTIIKFSYFDEKMRYALVTALGQEKITLQFAHRKEIIPLREAERYWFGQMTVLWRLTPGKKRVLRINMQGKDVVWLRNQLQQIQEETLENKTPAYPEFFDEKLEKRLRKMQAKLFLVPDGIVGMRSIVAMDQAIKDPKRPIPRLNRILRDGDG